MKKSVLFALVMLFGVSLAEAGVVRMSAKVLKDTVRVASQPVRHPVKDAKAVRHAVRVAIW